MTRRQTHTLTVGRDRVLHKLAPPILADARETPVSAGRSEDVARARLRVRLTIEHLEREAPARPPSPPDDGGPAVQVWHDRDGAPAAYGWTIGDRHWLDVPGIATYRFDSALRGITANARPAAPVEVVEDTYRRTALPMALQVAGWEVLHASAIGTTAGAIAFCATSETGKSTIAYGLSQRGYPLWADDAVVLNVEEPAVRVERLPFRPRLRPASATYFGHKVSDPGGSGRLLWTGELDETTEGSMPLAAICVLGRLDRRDGSTITCREVPSLEAFRLVLAHGYCFNLHDEPRKRTMVRQYAQLVGRVLVVEVRFQHGLEHLPAILDHIAARLEAGPFAGP